ncbi:MAG: hypothetical protein ACYTDW_17825 [Planctomycetota bacterium]|jgi:hypothetical protein
MMRLVAYIALCLMVVGCGRHRDFTEYSLNENSFDSEAMSKIKQESGINLPYDAKGLAFHHIPPVDPIVFAKIKIPADAQNSLTKQIGALTFSGTQFPKDFANDRCKWWPAVPASTVLSKQAFNNGYYVELYLVKEKEHLILYIKYFTI